MLLYVKGTELLSTLKSVRKLLPSSSADLSFFAQKMKYPILAPISSFKIKSTLNDEKRILYIG